MILQVVLGVVAAVVLVALLGAGLFAWGIRGAQIPDHKPMDRTVRRARRRADVTLREDVAEIQAALYPSVGVPFVWAVVDDYDIDASHMFAKRRLHCQRSAYLYYTNPRNKTFDDLVQELRSNAGAVMGEVHGSGVDARFANGLIAIYVFGADDPPYRRFTKVFGNEVVEMEDWDELQRVASHGSGIVVSYTLSYFPTRRPAPHPGDVYTGDLRA